MNVAIQVHPLLPSSFLAFPQLSYSIVSAPKGWPLIVPCIVHCWRLCLSSVPSPCPQTLLSSLLLPFYACVGWNMVSLSHFSLQPHSLRANFQFIFIELSNIRTVRNSSVNCFCMTSSCPSSYTTAPSLSSKYHAPMNGHARRATRNAFVL